MARLVKQFARCVTPFLIFLLFLSSCGGSDNAGEANNGVGGGGDDQANTPPIADGGGDRTISSAMTVVLDGSSSRDDDGDTLTYLWTLFSAPDGSTASLNTTTGSEVSLNVDLVGDYIIRLVVNDGLVDSDIAWLTISYIQGNLAPTAVLASDLAISLGQTAQLDGSGSEDDFTSSLSYIWTIASVPEGSDIIELENDTTDSPFFTPDVLGNYVIQLIVNDGELNSDPQSMIITVVGAEDFIDDFSGEGELIDYVTNNALSLPNVTRVNNRYHANLENNDNNITLHFNDDQGRLDAKLARFPFEAIARNIGIGTQGDSQVAPSEQGAPYLFAGLQVHVTELDSRNSSHVVVGHRGNTSFTVEGKNTVNGDSSVNDAGENIVPGGRADIRIVGNSDRSLTVYWQRPNLDHTTVADNWVLYNGTGNLPGTNPDYGAEVYVGIITYAFGQTGLPFVGTCDRLEIRY